MPRQGVLFETPVLTFFAVRDGFDYKFWVYILVSRTGTLYIGITGYFDRRILQHKMDSIEGFTKKYKIHRLVYYETYDQVQRALGPEAQTFHIQGQRNAPPAEASEHVVSGLPIRSSDPKNPCSKHRCLQLFFRRGTDFLSEPVVTVDLTAKHVSVERGKSK